MVREIENEPSVLTVCVGTTLYADPPEYPDEERHNLAWRGLFSTIPAESGAPLEIQYEFRYETRFWKVLPQLLNGLQAKISLHAPIKARDIASSDETLRKYSIEETKKAMQLAHELSSTIFVLHLTPQDQGEERDEQLKRGFASFETLTRYKSEMGFVFPTALETLEYPKWPSNLEETIHVLERALRIDPDVEFCIDVAHLWHNLVSLRPDGNPGIDFPTYLQGYIEEVDRLVPVKRFHIGQAYVQEEGEEILHETHAIPGLLRGGDLTANTRLALDYAPTGFQGLWLNINSTLRVVHDFAQGKINSQDIPPDVILEIKDPRAEVQLRIKDIIQSQIRLLG